MRELELSLLRACPVRCVYCPQTLLSDKTRELKLKTPGVMSLDTLRKVLSNMSSGGLYSACVVHFAGFTEPLLHPNFLDLFWECEMNSCVKEIVLYTTGEGLTAERLRMLSRSSKLRRAITLNVNWESALNQKEVSPIQPGANGDIWKLRPLINELFPDATWAFVRKPKPRHLRNQVAEKLKGSKILWPKEISRAGNLARQRTGEPEITHNGPVTCGKVTSRRMPVVLPDGSCQACCQDYGLSLPIGNLATHTWDELDYDSIIEKQQTPSKGCICFTGCDRARLI